MVGSIEDKQNSSIVRLHSCASAVFSKATELKNTRKRMGVTLRVAQASESSPDKQLKLVDTQNGLESVRCLATSRPRSASTLFQQPGKMPVILDNNRKSDKSNNATNKTVTNFINRPVRICDKQLPSCPNDFSKTSGYANKSDDAVDSDALNDYLNGGNNSQEQEEELLQYFQQSNSSSSDLELSGLTPEAEQSLKQDEVSQLRIILHENLKDSVSSTKAGRQSVPVNKRHILPKHNMILPTILRHSNPLNTRRRVSFETNTIEQSQDKIDTTRLSSSSSKTMPQSPNTRRRIFNFTPISPGPHSPINERASKSSSTNASPFVSPRNTPIPRSRSNLPGSCRPRSSQKVMLRSMSCNEARTPNRNDMFMVPTNGSETIRQVHSPLVAVSNKTSHSLHDLTYEPPNLACVPFLSDLAAQKPLLINYPSQENLQEIKNAHQIQWPDREISKLLQSERQQYVKKQIFCRSQSVPLHRMVDPALLSPITTHYLAPSSLSHSFNPSASSSIATTPVPSESNDFSSIGPCEDSGYLLDVGPLASTDRNFLIENKELIEENLSYVFDLLDEEEPKIVPGHTTVKQTKITDSNSAMTDPLPNENLSNSILQSDSIVLGNNWMNVTTLNNNSVASALLNNGPKMIHSRSYPNTPLPIPNASFAVQCPEDSNGSRSYPTTPLNNLQQGAYRENNEPMLFEPSFNAVNLPNQSLNISTVCSTSVECNVADLLEPNVPQDETEDLGSLSNFEALQDVVTISPLFTEFVD